MAGRPIDPTMSWSPWDTDMFEKDDKIFDLLDKRQSKGFLVYFYLCQHIYSTGGYFIAWDSARSPSRIAHNVGCALSPTAVQDIVNNCLLIGLFDKRMYDERDILTSHAIQTRYASYMKSRVAKTTHCVIGEYWLLSDAETQKLCPGLAKVGLAENFSRNNSDFSAKNGNFSSIRGDSNYNTHTTPPRREDVELYFRDQGCDDPGEVDAFIKYNEGRGWDVAGNWQHYASLFLEHSKKRASTKKTKSKAQKDEIASEPSFDVDKFFLRALNKSYGG